MFRAAIMAIGVGGMLVGCSPGGGAYYGTGQGPVGMGTDHQYSLGLEPGGRAAYNPVRADYNRGP